MLTLIRNGGFPMLFILAFGLTHLVASGWYVYRPNPRSAGFILWMGGATLFSTLMGIASDFGATFFAVSKMIEQGTPQWHALLLEGLAESMSPAIMGFSLLGITSFLAAVGRARQRA